MSPFLLLSCLFVVVPARAEGGEQTAAAEEAPAAEPDYKPGAPLDPAIIRKSINRFAPKASGKKQVEITKGVIELFSKLPKDQSQWVEYINKNAADPEVGAVAKSFILKSMPPVKIEPTPPAKLEPTAPNAGAAQNATPPVPPDLAVREDIAREFHQRDPRNPETNFELGQVDYQKGDYSAAARDFGQAYDLGDHRPVVLVDYAGAAFHAGDYAAAERAAALALQADPNNREARALYEFSKGRAPKVNLPSSFGELSSNPSPGETASGGAAPAGAGFVGAPPPSGMTAEQVAAAARQAAAAGPDAAIRSGQYTKDAANAMRVHDYPTAYQIASQAVALNPSNAQALNYRAMSLSHMQRYSDAVQDASAALSLAPGNGTALLTRSWAFGKQGKYNEALKDVQAASSSELSNSFLYQDKALALAGLGDRAGTIEALRKAAELDPRWTNRLERAVQMPQDADLTLLFDDGGAPAPAPAPASRPRRFARLAVLSATGGLLVALGILHIVSASWREKMRLTMRRVLGPSVAAAGSGAAAPAEGSGAAFWTQYELVKEIGLGGMGVVYEAVDRSLERRVAVKKMRDEIRLDPADRGRFVAEARMVAQLHHPNIVDIYGIVEDGMDVYLVFEFVEGRTLEDALKSGGPMDVPGAARIIKEMAAAVAHAHERGIIHRDLKPSNVMLTSEGRVKVMDFGIARQAKDAMTRHSMTNTIAGTPPYMAPEQEQGTVRKESDVYALGVCLYEMTTGQLPFVGSGAAMLLNKLNGKLIPATQRAPNLPQGLDAVIVRALTPDPDKRFRTPAELVAALDVLLASPRA
jgi:tetratricopeptide (TPR) repeat protein